MRAHYSTVGLDEKRVAVDGAVSLVSLPKLGTGLGTGLKRKKAS